MNCLVLSIIIPIYNGGSHLRRTVESVLSSGIDSFTAEILLVDDGSVDNSASICRYFVENHPHLFKYYYKPNGGLSSARNFGIQKATGQYIYFLDDDDLLRPGSLGLFYRTHFHEKYDVLGFSSDTVDDSMVICLEEKGVGTVLFEGEGRQFMDIRTPTFVWVYWYKRLFLLNNNLEFTIIYPEDCMFNLCVFRVNPYVLISSQKVICYMNYDEPGQLTKERNPKRLRQILSGYMSYFTALSNSQNHYNISGSAISLAAKTQLVPFVSRCLSSDISRKEFYEYKRELKNLNLLEFAPPIKRVTRICLFIINTAVFFPLYQFFYSRFFVKYILPRLSRG